MPNGYALARRIFTVTTKVDFGHLRKRGHNSVAYIADLYLQGDTYQSCLTNILDTVNLLRELGFVIHSDKSVLNQVKENFFRIYYIVKAHGTVLILPCFHTTIR